MLNLSDLPTERTPHVIDLNSEWRVDERDVRRKMIAAELERLKVRLAKDIEELGVRRGVGCFLVELDKEYVHEGNGDLGKAFAAQEIRRDLHGFVQYTTLVEGKTAYLHNKDVYQCCLEYLDHESKENEKYERQKEQERIANEAKFVAKYGTYTNPANGKKLLASTVTRQLKRKGYDVWSVKSKYRTPAHGETSKERYLSERTIDVVKVSCNKQDFLAIGPALSVLGYKIVDSKQTEWTNYYLVRSKSAGQQIAEAR